MVYVLISVKSIEQERHSLHSQMASSFITNSYQINFESVLMIHDNEGMLNMFKALEASGLRQFLGCESILYEAELGHFFETALLQDEDITCAISGKFITISPSLFTTVFDLPTEGITNFAEVPKEKVYDARSFFSQKGVQVDVHGKKKFLKHEFRLLNDILAKAITVKAGSFDSVTVERFQMMTAIHYGLKVNWGHVLFNVLKDMVDKSQKKAKGFAAQIGALLKSIPAIPMGNGVPFPSAKVLSMRTVHTYTVTNSTIDARTESEEQGMANAPIITKKRRTGKSKLSVSQAKLDIVQVATDIEPIHEVHGKKKFMKHEFRLLNDILAKAITVKAGSFDSVTVERFQMMTAIQYGLKVNWGKVLFDVLKDMVDRTQKKAKGFAAAKVLSMRTVHTYIVTNTTIDARTESEEPGMAKTPKGTKKHSSADEMPVDMFAEFTASKKRSATASDAPIITKKRRTGKSKPSVSQAKLDIVQVATDVEPIQIVDPTHVEETVPPLVLKRKSRKRKLVLSRESDDDSVGTEEIFTKADDVVVMSTVEADIAKVLEETLALGVTETERESQVFDEALFEEDFTRWLDDFVARHSEPELGSIHSVAYKEVNMPIDDLLVQICDDLLLPVTAAEVTMLRLGAFSSPGEKGKAKLGEDDQVTDNAARKFCALICRDVEVLVQVRDHLMQAVVDFFASFSLNSMPSMDSLKELKEKERLMMAWAETNTLAIAVRRQLYVLAKYRELLLRTVLEYYQIYLTSALPWNAMAVQVANLLSVAHSNSIEELKAQQQELNIELVQSHSSLPAMDYTDSGGVRLAHFYSIANSRCWVRPVILIDGVWTPIQGPEFWSNSCNLSLFLDNLQMPRPAIQKLFIPLNSFIAPDQYWATVPCLMRIWHWTKVCEEVVAFNLSGGLRPVRKDASYANTVHNLGVERIPANFLRLFAQGLACNNFVDSVVKKDLGDGEDIVLTDIEEVELVSSDVSTVYRSPSPPSPGVDSLEHDLRYALGPAIFSRTEQEERLYFVQSPDLLQRSLHTMNPVLLLPMFPCIMTLQIPPIIACTALHDSNCEMLAKLNSVELGVRGDLLKMQSLLRQSFETACRVLERQSNTHTAQITDLKKGLLGPVGIIFGDLIEIKKKQREQDAKQQSMDEQIAAIRNEHLEFQSKIAADMLSLSTQVGDIADFLRSGVAKKGEVGSSSRPTTVRAQTQTLPPTTGTFEERVAQARRNILETGQVISVEEAAARVIENDRRESERLERERRDRRQSRSGTYKRRR
ncbi:hypothetical protein F511_24698 [Dorcoceras hygrometricum]|uniref:Dystroglycan-like n=1 Tax=Dorcoceras hygrometricum TaxID=472368 RepID=A0A2Z7DL19_9LAMI|nr:hypothetical protein F511_24698 [Dorcoceras hygrometricum]